MTDRPRKKPPTYTPAPHLPRQLSERYELILKVLAGQMTVSEAARQLGMARNHFQHLMHRAQDRLIEGLSPRPLGRPPKPASAKTLETENRRLRHRTEVLERRLERQEKVLEATTELIRDRISTSHYRARKTRKTRKKSSSTSKNPTPDDSDGPAVWLEQALELRRNGLGSEQPAALAGVSPSTLRRWSARQRIGRAPIGRRGPSCRGDVRDDELARRVAELVRQSRGLFGAEALSHAVPGVSRREAAAIKRASASHIYPASHAGARSLSCI